MLEKNSNILDEVEDAEDVSEDEDDPFFNLKDSFTSHFDKDIKESIDLLESNKFKKLKNVLNLNSLGRGYHEFCSEFQLPQNETDLNHSKLKIFKSLAQFNIKQSILRNLARVISNYQKTDQNLTSLNELQLELLSILDSYLDLFYTQKKFKYSEQFRLVYCLHILNHVLKSRSRIIHHNNKLSKSSSVKEYRDQGLVRPKVIVLVPFRESAWRTVNCLINLFGGGDEDIDEVSCSNKPINIINGKRFKQEFYQENENSSVKKPQDFNDTFFGNIDDSFRIGISITKRSLKLYSEFYSSDIIIASPLGLRLIIGSEGEKDRDFDFLNSIEILLLDQADIFLFQNWEHVIDIFKHLHIQPTSFHGVDFSRVRLWALEGQYKYYRQTIFLSSINSLHIQSLFFKESNNFDGRVIIHNPILPTQNYIRLVYVKIQQKFIKFESKSVVTSPDERFSYFINSILPNIKGSCETHVLVYIPSYFDFVRVRNYFRKEDVNFTQICEYSESGKIAQSRAWFFHGGRNILLYTERCHFYNRFKIKGIKHLIFYQLPTYPHFYSEICNLLHPSNHSKKLKFEESLLNCSALFDRYDFHQLEQILGTSKALELKNSEKSEFFFINQQEI